MIELVTLLTPGDLRPAVLFVIPTPARGSPAMTETRLAIADSGIYWPSCRRCLGPLATVTSIPFSLAAASAFAGQLSRAPASVRTRATRRDKWDVRCSEVPCRPASIGRDAWRRNQVPRPLDRYAHSLLTSLEGVEYS